MVQPPEAAPEAAPKAFPEDERPEYCGDPVEPLCGPDLGLPWCHYHNGTSVNPYE